MVLVCFTAVLCVVMQCFCCVVTQKTAVWTRLRIGGKRKKKSYFTLFFAFSATAEPRSQARMVLNKSNLPVGLCIFKFGK